MYNVFRISYTILNWLFTAMQAPAYRMSHLYTHIRMILKHMLLRQKKQWSSNQITYCIAGNFCGRTFYKMVGKKDLFREHFHKLLTCANKKHPCSQILWRKLSCITTRAQKSWKFLPWKFPTIQYQWMAYLYNYVVKALIIITGDSMAQFEAIYLLVLIQLMHRSLERDKGCILKKQ